MTPSARRWRPRAHPSTVAATTAQVRPAPPLPMRATATVRSPPSRVGRPRAPRPAVRTRPACRVADRSRPAFRPPPWRARAQGASVVIRSAFHPARRRRLRAYLSAVPAGGQRSARRPGASRTASPAPTPGATASKSLATPGRQPHRLAAGAQCVPVRCVGDRAQASPPVVFIARCERGCPIWTVRGSVVWGDAWAGYRVGGG